LSRDGSSPKLCWRWASIAAANSAAALLGASSASLAQLILTERGLLGILATSSGLALGFFLIADIDFRVTNIFLWTIRFSLAGGSAAWRPDCRLRPRRCSRDYYPARLASASIRLRLIH